MSSPLSATCHSPVNGGSGAFVIAALVVILLILLIVSLLLTSLYGWTVERMAYRPLRGSFRLAPLISAIGMSIFLSNFVQVAQGARNKPTPPMVRDVIVLFEDRLDLGR